MFKKLIISVLLILMCCTTSYAYRDLHSDYIRNTAGAVVASATVKVYLAGTSTVANIYEALSDTIPVASVTTGTDGLFTFYIDRFDYDSDQKFKIIATKDAATTTYDNVTINRAIVQTYTISADKTVSTNLKIPKGVIYSVASTKTLTLNGAIEAGLYQIFSGSGTIAFGTNYTKEVYPEWWGVTGTNDYIPIQSAASSLTNGGIIRLTGSYTYTTNIGVSLLDNTWVRGNGTGKTVITGGGVAIFDATNRSNIKISDLSSMASRFLSMVGGSSLIVENVNINGYLSPVYIHGQGIWLYGVTHAVISSSIFTDFNDAIYLDANPTGAPGTYTTDVKIDKCRISHSNHGVWDNPVGVYIYYAKDVNITNNTFLNILPGGVAVGRMGYGVYEGDGSADKINISGNTFEDNDATNGKGEGILISTSPSVIINGNNFIGNGVDTLRGIDAGGTGSIIISNNILKSGFSIFAGNNPYLPRVIISNNLIDSSNEYGIRIGATPYGVTSAVVSGNIINKSAMTGILINICSYADILGNFVIDSNTSDSGTDYRQSGIVFYGSVEGIVRGNYISNETVLGLTKYGIDFSGTAGKFLYDTNVITGMTSTPMRYGYTAVPAQRTWVVGDRILNMTPVIGQPKAWSCTVSGTMGTLNGGATTGDIGIGSATLTVSSATGLAIKQYITIAGVTGVKRIIDISGTTVTIDAVSDATVAGAAVAFSPATFVSEGNL